MCVRHHVLIYHYCMVTEPYDRFNRFVNSTEYNFATVETTDDVKALRVTGLACKNLVKIRENYRVWGSTKQDSLVELASAIINPYYEKMNMMPTEHVPYPGTRPGCGNWMNLTSGSRPRACTHAMRCTGRSLT